MFQVSSPKAKSFCKHESKVSKRRFFASTGKYLPCDKAIFSYSFLDKHVSVSEIEPRDKAGSGCSVGYKSVISLTLLPVSCHLISDWIPQTVS